MLVNGALYEDIGGRIFTINIVKDHVHINLIEGSKFKQNPISKQKAENWKKAGFWKRKIKKKYDVISKNYNI